MLARAAETFRLLASSHLLLLLILLLRDHRQDKSARITAGFIATVICYLTFPVLWQYEVTRVSP